MFILILKALIPQSIDYVGDSNICTGYIMYMDGIRFWLRVAHSYGD